MDWGFKTVDLYVVVVIVNGLNRLTAQLFDFSNMSAMYC